MRKPRFVQLVIMPWEDPITGRMNHYALVALAADGRVYQHIDSLNAWRACGMRILPAEVERKTKK